MLQKHPHVNFGSRITGGIQHWQIFQQDDKGVAHVALHGTFSLPPEQPSKKPGVYLRVVREEDGAPASQATDWAPAEVSKSGKWQTTLHIPAGGLYRIETGIKTETNCTTNLFPGDFVHNIGVGDLWVIAGQSNAVGYGRGAVIDPPELGVHLLANNEKWSLATHPLGDCTGNEHFNLEGMNPAHSAFLAFAKILKHELGYPIGLIHTALGGSPLSMWNPDQDPKAPLYHNMIHCARLAGGKVKGMVWYQGESDTGVGFGRTYQKRFAQFVRHTRKDLGKIPILTAQLNRCVIHHPEELHREWSLVREAQRLSARVLRDVAVIPTTDLGLSDAIHTSSAGNLTLGSRFATSALGLVYKKPVHFHYPEIASATTKGKAVLLEFDHVTHQLSSEYPKVEDFVIVDRSGPVGIEKVIFQIPNHVRIELSRRLKGKAVIHGGYGVDPKTTVYEMSSIRPLLAFYNFPIKTA